MAQYVYTMNRVGKVVPPNRHILKDISLSFFPGAKIGVLGLNGSGKSTLLKSIMGLIPIQNGRITIFEQEFKNVLQRVAYVPQKEQIDFNFPKLSLSFSFYAMS